MAKNNPIIKKVRIAIQGEMLAEEQRHDRKMKKLGQKLYNLQKTCNHQDHTWHGDPSGNNDSFNECNDCLKQF